MIELKCNECGSTNIRELYDHMGNIIKFQCRDCFYKWKILQ